jgi:hypothetical protein
MPISNPMGNMSRKTRFHIGYWVAAILGFLVLQYFYVYAQKVASIPYSQFEQLLREHKVSEVGFPITTSKASSKSRCRTAKASS